MKSVILILIYTMLVASFRRQLKYTPAMRLMAKRTITEESDEFTSTDGKRPSRIISWYPGHIAKAERELADYLKKVDVVIEVRDCRIPLSTTHPLVPQWVGNKPLIVAIARLDLVSKKALNDWKKYYQKNSPYETRPDSKVFFIDGKTGSGVLALKKEALKASVKINAKRVSRGIEPRAVRAAVIGFPNVGKSTLINRLLGRKLAKAKNMAGVTRQLQWIRIGGGLGSDQSNSIELLDSPGIIPAKHLNQEVAVKLAICNDIGEASYDRVTVAAAMIDYLNALYKKAGSYVNMAAIIERYKIPINELTGEEVVERVADKFYHNNDISAADRLLNDFRKGLYSAGSLECVKEAPIYEKIQTEEVNEQPEISIEVPQKQKKPKSRLDTRPVVESDTVYKYDDDLLAAERLDEETLAKIKKSIAIFAEKNKTSKKKNIVEKPMGEVIELSDKEIGQGGHVGW